MNSTIAGRLKELREDRGLTQPELAERSGISAAGIAAIEQGRRSPVTATVYALARGLDVPAALLLDRHDRLPASAPGAGILAVRDALQDPAELPGMDDGDGEPVTLTYLEGAVADGWRMYWRGDLTGLAALLPGLIGQARAARPARGIPAAGPLAQAYQLAACLMVHMGDDNLAYAAAYRGIRAAGEGDDPLRSAALYGTASWALLHQGRLADAERVAVRAADRIGAGPDDACPHRTVHGSLLLTAVAPAAAAGDAAMAAEYLAAAMAGAAPYAGGDRHDLECNYGPTQCAMQVTHAQAVLHRPRQALAAARRVRREDLRAISWGALHLDIAQARMDGRDVPGAKDALWTAYQVSRDWARAQGPFRVLAAALVRVSLDDRTRELAAAARIG